MNVLIIYKKLLAHFGPQGWWPIFDAESRCCKYFIEEKHPLILPERSPASEQARCGVNSTESKAMQFEICIGAILTQNTAWTNVTTALENLLNVGTGRDLSLPKFILSCKNLEAIIQPAGYYNQKAKKLRIFSKWWLSQFSPLEKGEREGVENFSSLSLISCRSSLLSLWGIGPETADSMLLYAFNKPIFVIDAYTKRLCKECGVEFKTYDEYRQFFESQLSKSAAIFNEYHALIVAWGKLHTKNRETALKIIK